MSSLLTDVSLDIINSYLYNIFVADSVSTIARGLATVLLVLVRPVVQAMQIPRQNIQRGVVQVL